MLGQAVNASTALDRHYEVMDTENTIVSPERPAPVNPAAAIGAVRLDGVHFRYADAPEHVGDVLDGVDLDIRPGETMALVGVTGGGKSTPLRLVPRLYDTTAGAITIDDVDIRDMDLTTRAPSPPSPSRTRPCSPTRCGTTSLLGADPALSERDAEDLSHLAPRTADATYAYEPPDGVDTRIGEEGMSLSGGQRQRLALARAIAAKPAVLCCSTTRSRRWTPRPRRPSPRACGRCSPGPPP
ncbi:ABC transporter ATP-binding protein [Brachybacterium sp. GPGPB12]|uniref:ABC transporter ATP-binding protein n=1 Tax=Brachybacterium sp. GPGPB12 TaxID=3023517 RepID=UPI0031344190